MAATCDDSIAELSCIGTEAFLYRLGAGPTYSRSAGRLAKVHSIATFNSAIQGGRVAKVVEIGGAGPEAWWSGSGGEVKVGG
jgi:hypothetical protein